MNHRRRARPRLSRSARVPTPGLRARLDDVSGDLLNISATGVLVRTDRELRAGRHSLVFDLQGKRIGVAGQVVRCEPATIKLPGGATMRRSAYEVGVKFLELPSDLTAAIGELYGGVPRVDEVPYRILVVGDDPALNSLLEETLAGGGYFVRVANNPRHVVTRAKNIQADAVVVNVLVERERSIWWVLELLVADPETRETPLVVLTDPASVNPDVRRYLAERRVRLLALPFTPEELFTALERVLRESTHKPRGDDRS